MVKKTGKMYVFEFEGEAEEVILKGSWNNWKGERMKKNKKGIFTKRKKLDKGIYEFGYLSDGKWMADESCKLKDSPFGGKNSVLEVR